MNIWKHIKKYKFGYGFILFSWAYVASYLLGESFHYGPAFTAHLVGRDELLHHLPIFTMLIFAPAVGYIIERQIRLLQIKEEVEARYSALVENARDAIIIIQEGKLRFVNTASLKLVGYPSKELIEKDFLELIVPEEREMVRERYTARIEGKVVPSIYEINILRSDGTAVLVEVNVELIEHEGRPAELVFIRDMTERKRAEVMLRESEKRLKTLLDSIPTGILVIDTETHKIVDANPVAVKMIGTTKKKVIGSICHKYICPDEKGSCPIIDQGRDIDSSERILLKADGKEVPILKTVVPMIVKGRRHLVESFIDITERKQTEEVLERSKGELESRVDARTRELKESRDALLNLMEDLENSHERLEVAYEELKEIDRMKNDLIANVSHELKTPLTIALSAIELARDEGMEKERITMLQMCEDAIVREERIVEDLLELATFEKEKLKLKIEPIDIVDLVSSCEAEIGPSILNRGIKMETSVQKGIPRVLADRTRLKHALSNLLNNAIKFNKEGGSIKVDVKKKAGNVEVSVADTGVGIENAHLDRIFDRFYQADASSRRRYGGSGIGLAIVKEIVDVHGGRIWAESEPGEGTKITFTLPLEYVKPKKKKK